MCSIHFHLHKLAYGCCHILIIFLTQAPEDYSPSHLLRPCHVSVAPCQSSSAAILSALPCCTMGDFGEVSYIGIMNWSPIAWCLLWLFIVTITTQQKLWFACGRSGGQIVVKTSSPLNVLIPSCSHVGQLYVVYCHICKSYICKYSYKCSFFM